MTHYVAHPDMVARRIRGESILVPIARTMDGLDNIITLNETAEFIRQRAAEGLDEAAIAEALVADFDITPDEARTDVAAVLGELVAIGALQPRESR
ncbi:MAG TPA: PqqD family protein [Kiritimatiellia bacterium]|nr:PqqD family protein [Kiritimatiellia bacterium]HMP34915.1 PqqD family protein [Kiritimatiellia bacterium]